MFDAGSAYAAYDVAIGDPVVTHEEDVEMHILVLGQRHRTTPDQCETACGCPSPHPRTLLRVALTLVDGDMCPACFTPHEMLRAMQADADALNAADERRRRWDAEAEAKRKRNDAADKERWAQFIENQRRRNPTEGDDK